MKLQKLLENIGVLETNLDMETEITDVVYDSRKVTPGSLFVAVTGFATDGNLYIPMALEKGAVAVVTARKPEGNIPYALVESDRVALARLGANFYDHPADSMKLIGITGTNGKTSSTLLLKHVLETVLGAKVGLMGTMENLIGNEVVATERTTPESFDLQGLLARMRDGGCQYVIMEVSSHALQLERVAGLRYHVAAFTNLTEDHLDFHGSMENYCDAKALLFDRCDHAVANGDDPWFSRMCGKASCKVLTTSGKTQADLYARDTKLLSDGIAFTAVHGQEQVDVTLPIPGKFTVYNALTVLGCSLEMGISLQDAANALKTAKGVKGRVEVVPTGKPFTVLIDYAHTPDGLENVLSSVKGFCNGRLIAVFGCGGDRDPIKRPIMGRIATEIADYTVVTSDNPRTENPAKIIEDIAKGIDPEKNNYEIVENRVEAIHRAMDIAEKDDIIVLAGKGHETYQEINHVKHHLDEREVVAAHLEKMR